MRVDGPRHFNSGQSEGDVGDTGCKRRSTGGDAVPDKLDPAPCFFA